MLVMKAHAMRIDANLPADMWPECVMAAGYAANRTPAWKLKWKTPYESVLK